MPKERGKQKESDGKYVLPTHTHSMNVFSKYCQHILIKILFKKPNMLFMKTLTKEKKGKSVTSQKSEKKKRKVYLNITISIIALSENSANISIKKQE